MKIFRKKKKLKTVIDLLQKIYDDKYKTNSPFNVMIKRNDTNDIQIIHSGLLQNLGIKHNGEFGFLIYIPFDSTKQFYLEKFNTSRFYNIFSFLESDSDGVSYYYDCKLDIQLVEKLCFEICDEIYDYNNQTKFEFEFIEY